jgi:hypothetical protein
MVNLARFIFGTHTIPNFVESNESPLFKDLDWSPYEEGWHDFCANQIFDQQ